MPSPAPGSSKELTASTTIKPKSPTIIHLVMRSTPLTTPNAQIPKAITVVSTAQNSICHGSAVRALKTEATASVVMGEAVKVPVRHFQK